MTDTPENTQDPTVPSIASDPPEPKREGSSKASGTGWRATPHWYVAEIIVVVVGVMIALGANAWWEGWREGRLESEVLRAVQQELVESRASLESILAATDSCLEGTDRFLRSPPDVLSSVSPDDALLWVSSLSCRQTFDPTLSVAGTLNQAPGLDTVEDIRIRAAVAGWVRSLADAEEERLDLSRWGDAVYQAMTPYAMNLVEGGLPEFPTIPQLVARGAPAVLPELRQDHDVVRAVILKAHYQRAYRQELSKALLVADSALALLGRAGHD